VLTWWASRVGSSSQATFSANSAFSRCVGAMMVMKSVPSTLSSVLVVCSWSPIAAFASCEIQLWTSRIYFYTSGVAQWPCVKSDRQLMVSGVGGWWVGWASGSGFGPG
jgi:hypothetical protein